MRRGTSRRVKEGLMFKLHGRTGGAPAPAGSVGDHLDRLSRIRRLAVDYDEQQNREDRDYGNTLFTRAPFLRPRYLRRGR
jgi:hypothetical protein